MADGIALIPLTGIGEVEPGVDLARMVAGALAPLRAGGPELRDGDVLVVTQKVVSKAEGRLVDIDPDDPEAKAALVEQESVRIVRRRETYRSVGSKPRMLKERRLGIVKQDLKVAHASNAKRNAPGNATGQHWVISLDLFSLGGRVVREGV